MSGFYIIGARHLGREVLEYALDAAQANPDLRGASVTVVHPTAFVSRRATVGAGCIVCPGAFVGSAAVVADNVLLNQGSAVNHDSAVGAVRCCRRMR